MKIFPTQEDFVRRVVNWLGQPAKPTVAQEIAELGAAIGSSVGEVRGENQDRAVIARFSRLPFMSPDSESLVLFALCDGMGGLASGAQCAQIAIASLIASLLYSDSSNPRSGLSDAIKQANDEVYRRFKGRGGTTIAAVLLSRDQPVACSVGDSRIYAVEGKEKVRQISSDDTVAGEVSRATGVDVGDLRLGRIGPGLAQFVGMGDGIEPRIYDLNPASNELVFCLTSDGAHSVARSVFEQVVRVAPNPYACVTRLLQLSRWCGGLDNATVVVGRPAANVATAPPAFPPGSGIELWDSQSKFQLSFAICSEIPTKPLPSSMPSFSRAPVVPPTLEEGPAAHASKESKKRRQRDRPGGKKIRTGDETRGQAKLEIEIKPGDPASTLGSSSQEDTSASEKPVESRSGGETGRPPEENGNGSL